MEFKKIIVFDLDFTLWDAGGTWCDCTCPPFVRKNGYVVDSEGAEIILYSNTTKLLENLKKEGYLLAVASRTGAPDWARKLMKLFEIDQYFDFEEIYPSSKISHFRQIQAKSGIPYSQMVFFDDEHRNIEDVASLGVKAVFVRNGINEKLVFDNLS